MSRLTYATVLRERHQRVLRVERGAEQAVFLAVPEREDDRAARVLRRVPERPHEREHRGDARRVVGRAVADVVAGADVAAGVTEMVVVGADR